MRTVIAACALSLVAAGPIVAHAAVGAATLSNFHIELADLDPNDGIDPAFTLTPTQQIVQTSLGPTMSDSQVIPTWTDAQSRSTSPTAQATATAGGQHFMSAELTASFAHSLARSNRSGSLVVSPNTEFTLVFDVALSASVSPCADLLCENLGASAFVMLHADPGDEPPFYSKRVDAFGFDPDVSHSETLRMTWQSASTGWDGRALINVSTTSETVPIPEPQTYALMLVGLVACAWAVRRRRSA